MPVFPATPSDIPQLLPLINGAFRGDSARRGWTSEADLLLGTKRTDEATLSNLMQLPGAIILKYCNEENILQGCVFLHKKERGLYLGMLTVDPELQGGGIGKKLMSAAEEHARATGCRSIFMNVFSVREELIAWYERLGYHRTGEMKPYDANPDFGTPTRPLEFAIMEKMMMID